MAARLKILGITLVATLALSAGVASVASATGFKFLSEKPSTILVGKQHGVNTDVLETNGGLVTCNELTYSGAHSGMEATELELSPKWSNCSAFGFISVPIDSEGCKYRFTTGAKEGSNFEGSTDITCPEGKRIDITAPGCNVTIPTQTPTGGKITYTNLSSGSTREITIDVALTGIHYIEDEISGLPNCTSAGVTTTNGTYTGALLLTGESENAHVGLWVESQSKLHSEAEHTSLTGSQSTTNVYTFGILLGSVECEVATFDGTVTTKEVTEITLKPAYSKCTGVKREVTTHMNGCAYVITFGEEASSGKLDIECPSGEVIETTVDAFPGGCTIEIGSQSPGGSVDVKGEGSGKTRDLVLTWTIEGIKYTRSTCEAGGEGTNGALTGSVTVKGENKSAEQVGIWVE